MTKLVFVLDQGNLVDLSEVNELCSNGFTLHNTERTSQGFIFTLYKYGENNG